MKTTPFKKYAMFCAMNFHTFYLTQLKFCNFSFFFKVISERNGILTYRVYKTKNIDIDKYYFYIKIISNIPVN